MKHTINFSNCGCSVISKTSSNSDKNNNSFEHDIIGQNFNKPPIIILDNLGSFSINCTTQ